MRKLIKDILAYTCIAISGIIFEFIIFEGNIDIGAYFIIAVLVLLIFLLVKLLRWVYVQNKHKKICIQIRNEFSFLVDYGYSISCDMSHEFKPSVVYFKEDDKLIVGMNEKERSMFADYISSNIKRTSKKHLLEGMMLSEKTYLEQIDITRNIVINFLEKNSCLN